MFCKFTVMWFKPLLDLFNLGHFLEFIFFYDFFSLFFSVLKVILASCWTFCTGVQFLYLYAHFLSFCLFFFLKVSLNFVFHPRGLGQSRGRVPVLTAYCPWPDNRRERQRSSWSWKLTSVKCSLQLSSSCVQLDGQLPSLSMLYSFMLTQGGATWESSVKAGDVGSLFCVSVLGMGCLVLKWCLWSHCLEAQNNQACKIRPGMRFRFGMFQTEAPTCEHSVILCVPNVFL